MSNVPAFRPGCYSPALLTPLKVVSFLFMPSKCFFILNKPGARFIYLTLCLHSSWLCNTSVSPTFSVAECLNLSPVPYHCPPGCLRIIESEAHGMSSLMSALQGWHSEFSLAAPPRGVVRAKVIMLLKQREVLDESHYGNEHLAHSTLNNAGVWNYKLRTVRAGRYPRYSNNAICFSWFRVSSI